MQLLVFCNPENRRIDLLRQSAVQTGWSIKPISYERLLTDAVDLEAEARGCIAARIDSPGENFAVERMLLARGSELAAQLGYQCLAAEAALRLEYELGRIHFPGQYFLGFTALLHDIDAQLPSMRWMNSPQSVGTMFDKPATVACVQAQGLQTPIQLGVFASFEQLRELLEARGLKRVFVKLTTSSSASGVVAIVRQGDRLRATTTVEMVDGGRGERKLYNSLKLQHLNHTTEIERLIDCLVPHRIFAEQWLPKAAYDHRSTFDLRAMVIDGVATHFVPRVSSSPMTNLHLGNRRGDWAWVEHRLGVNLERFRQTCSQAAGAIQGVFYSGLDVVIDPTWKRFQVLEANACGDLLPGLVDVKGDSTYTAQLRRLAELLG